MVPEPGALAGSATAQEAGERLSDPAVRAVLVCADDGKFIGVVTRKTLVQEIVATGRDPSATQLHEIAEPPLFTLDASMDSCTRMQKRIFGTTSSITRKSLKMR